MSIEDVAERETNDTQRCCDCGSHDIRDVTEVDCSHCGETCDYDDTCDATVWVRDGSRWDTLEFSFCNSDCRDACFDQHDVAYCEDCDRYEEMPTCEEQRREKGEEDEEDDEEQFTCLTCKGTYDRDFAKNAESPDATRFCSAGCAERYPANNPTCLHCREEYPKQRSTATDPSSFCSDSCERAWGG